MTAINTAEEIKTALLALAEPTPPSEIRRRRALGKGGSPVIDPTTGEVKMLSYVTARFVQDRLDILGPENWQSTFQVIGGGAICTISIKLGGEWISKSDGADPSDIEGYKGQLSDALKRAAVQWGIARDLYDERDASHASVPARSAPATSPASAFPAGRTDADGTPVDACPVHNLPWAYREGVSKKTNKPYAFWSCPAPFPPGCKERPAEGWTPAAASTSGDPLDDIPF